MNAPQVHDLLRFDPALATTWSDAPAWVGGSVRRAPWAVVRRACPGAGIPIGIRGRTRSERFAARLEPREVRARVSPLDLARRFIDDAPLTKSDACPHHAVGDRVTNDACSSHPARNGSSAETARDAIAAAARAIEAAASSFGIRWGPVGSYGFELASGQRATHATSDLDIAAFVANTDIVRLPGFANTIATIEEATGVRIDVEVLFCQYGIALAEIVSAASRVLAKSDVGSRLIANPLAPLNTARASFA